MGYRIRTIENKFKIIEVNDGETKDVYESDDENRTRDIHRVLNSGGAFNGWIPDFFLQRFELSEV